MNRLWCGALAAAMAAGLSSCQPQLLWYKANVTPADYRADTTYCDGARQQVAAYTPDNEWRWVPLYEIEAYNDCMQRARLPIDRARDRAASIRRAGPDARTKTMKGRNVFHGTPRALARLVPLALVWLAACAGGPVQQTQLAPAGSTPDQIRFFCTQESDRAAAYVGFPPDYVAQRQRAADATFAACMARNHVQP